MKHEGMLVCFWERSVGRRRSVIPAVKGEPEQRPRLLPASPVSSQSACPVVSCLIFLRQSFACVPVLETAWMVPRHLCHGALAPQPGAGDSSPQSVLYLPCQPHLTFLCVNTSLFPWTHPDRFTDGWCPIWNVPAFTLPGTFFYLHFIFISI